MKSWARQRRGGAISAGLLDDDGRSVYGAGYQKTLTGGFMRSLRMLAIAGLTLSACSSTEWVHPNKPSSEYINDYNKCQNLVLRDPKLQQGSQLMILNATERCVQKEGWRLVEH
jgi:hypothetical protein